jgi:hypothetical protein
MKLILSTLRLLPCHHSWLLLGVRRIDSSLIDSMAAPASPLVAPALPFLTKSLVSWGQACPLPPAGLEDKHNTKSITKSDGSKASSWLRKNQFISSVQLLVVLRSSNGINCQPSSVVCHLVLSALSWPLHSGFVKASISLSYIGIGKDFAY